MNHCRIECSYPSTFWSWLFQPKTLRLHGKHRLWLQRAPEPSDIKWENFTASRWQPLARRFTSFILLLAVLLGISYSIFGVQAEKRKVQQISRDVDCSTLGGDVSNKTAVAEDVWWSQYGLSTGNTGRLGCYCKDLFATKGLAATITDSFLVPPANTDEVFLCSDWLNGFLASQAVIYGTTFLVLFFNVASRTAVSLLARFEKHTTITSELRVRGTYLFLLQLITTAGLTLLLNSYIDTS